MGLQTPCTLAHMPPAYMRTHTHMRRGAGVPGFQPFAGVKQLSFWIKLKGDQSEGDE